MAVRRRKGPGRPPAKDALGRFVFALRQLNSKVSKIKLRGRRSYYSYLDVQRVFARQEGRCYYDGMILQPTGYALNSVRFVHRVRIQSGGDVHESNLIAVCQRHAEEKDQLPTQPQARVIDFNTFGDLIAQLVGATLSKDAERIDYFKHVLDLTLAQFVQEMHAMPIGLEPAMPPPLDHLPSVSTCVMEIIHRLAEVFEEISYTHAYRPGILKSSFDKEDSD